MHTTLREFAELVGRCLATRWLREREALKSMTTPPAADEEGPAPCATACTGPGAAKVAAADDSGPYSGRLIGN